MEPVQSLLHISHAAGKRRRWLLPAGVDPSARTILAGRAVRAFVDGYVAVLLPAYLLALGLAPLDVGLLSTATLAGSALATLAVGAIGHRWPHRQLLLGAALAMTTTGFAFAAVSSFWPLALIAFVGTLNPSSGDVSVFSPLEQARLAEHASGGGRAALFARYSVTGVLFAAVGALAAGVPAWIAAHTGFSLLAAMRGMFAFYGIAGIAVWALYRGLREESRMPEERPGPLVASRKIVVRLAALFCIDSFAGGLVVNSLLALWLFQRFGVSLPGAGLFFFCAGMLSAASQLAAPVVARRIGLLNTMVFTHIPSSIFLILAALAGSVEVAIGFLLLRSALSQMDVPTRTAFVMALVTPSERSAAASFTAVPRSLASALSPSLGGALFAAGAIAAPLLACGVLKIVYDVILLYAFRKYRAPLD